MVRTYRVVAPLYDAFRRIWGRWTAETETRLDELFRAHVEPGTAILELGPGTGVNLVRLRRLGLDFARYVGIDASEEMLERARAAAGSDRRVELRRGDIRDLGRLEERFDLVVSTWVLSHLEDPAPVVRDALGCLGARGRAFLLFSGRPTSRWLATVLSPFYRWAGARFVDPGILEGIDGLESVERRNGGLATLALFRVGP